MNQILTTFNAPFPQYSTLISCIIIGGGNFLLRLP